MRIPATGHLPDQPVPLRHLLVALGLFLVWSNSFVAASFLLGSEGRPAQLDWVTLSVVRFATIAPLCLLYLLLFRRRQSLRILRRYPLRLVAGGLLAVPGYNLCLYYGQQHGVPPPIASLTTALLPLFLMILAAIFLHERLTRRKVAAFLVALAGLSVIALSRIDGASGGSYMQSLAITALAPLSWAIFTILSKPTARTTDPLDWTYLTIVVGSLPLLAVMPWRGGPELRDLSAGGWVALLYLSIACTLGGYAVWSWLLKHLPASTLGFTVFLNPPLTTVSKLALSIAFPAIFIWQVMPLEWVGGGLTLAGLALATWPQRRPSHPG